MLDSVVGGAVAVGKIDGNDEGFTEGPNDGDKMGCDVGDALG